MEPLHSLTNGLDQLQIDKHKTIEEFKKENGVTLDGKEDEVRTAEVESESDDGELQRTKSADPVEELAAEVGEVDPSLANQVRDVVHHHHHVNALAETFGEPSHEIEFIEPEEDPVANPHPGEGALFVDLAPSSTERLDARGALEPDDAEQGRGFDPGRPEDQEPPDGDEKPPLSVWQVIFTPPRIKQYFHENKLHRASHHRKTSWLELFFDLVFVAIVGKLGAHFSEEPSWARLSDFVVLFAPAWRVMADLNVWNDVYSSADISSSIMTAWIAIHVIGMGVTASAALPAGTVSAYIAIYLIDRVTFILLYTSYIILFPRFRTSFFLTLLSLFLPSCLWLVGLFLVGKSYEAMMGVFWGALIAEFAVGVVVEAAIRAEGTGGWSKRVGWRAPGYRPALNIEHTTERQGLLVILALGSFAVSLLFDAPTFDWFRFGKAILGLIIAMCLQWMYFDGVSRISQHALHRHYSAGIAWSLLHFPLVCFLILSGSTAASVVGLEDSDGCEEGNPQCLTASLAWSFSGSLSASYFVLLLLSFTHTYPHSTTTIIPSKIRKAALLIVIAVFALIPLGFHELNSMGLIASLAGVSGGIVGFEMFAKVGRGMARKKMVVP